MLTPRDGLALELSIKLLAVRRIAGFSIEQWRIAVPVRDRCRALGRGRLYDRVFDII